MSFILSDAQCEQFAPRRFPDRRAALRLMTKCKCWAGSRRPDHELATQAASRRMAEGGCRSVFPSEMRLETTFTARSFVAVGIVNAKESRHPHMSFWKNGRT